MEGDSLTRTKTKNEWRDTWIEKAQHLSRAYQCKADPVLFDQLDFAIKAVIAEIMEIADRMELEGVWDKTSIIGLKRGYDEWIHCGNRGSFVNYCMSVGVTLDDLEDLD